MTTFADLFLGGSIQTILTDEDFEIQALVWELRPGADALLIPTVKGDPGAPGAAGPPFIIQPAVADAGAALSAKAATLGPGNAGWAYPITGTNNVAFWNGSAFTIIANFTGLTGAVGPSPTFAIGTVSAGLTGTTPIVTVAAGTTTTYVLNFTLPTGPQGVIGATGPTGPSATIASAPDYDNSTAATEGQVMTYRAATSKWTPGSPTGALGPWDAAAAAFSAAAGTSANSRIQIADIQVPGQAVAWHPDVSGMIPTYGTGGATCDIEVRVGNATTGDLVAYATGVGATATAVPAMLGPPPGSVMTPSSSFGKIIAAPALTVTHFFVNAIVIANGTGRTWGNVTAGSRLRIRGIPVGV